MSTSAPPSMLTRRLTGRARVSMGLAASDAPSRSGPQRMRAKKKSCVKDGGSTRYGSVACGSQSGAGSAPAAASGAHLLLARRLLRLLRRQVGAQAQAADVGHGHGADGGLDPVGRRALHGLGRQRGGHANHAHACSRQQGRRRGRREAGMGGCCARTSGAATASVPSCHGITLAAASLPTQLPPPPAGIRLSLPPRPAHPPRAPPAPPPQHPQSPRSWRAARPAAPPPQGRCLVAARWG